MKKDKQAKKLANEAKSEAAQVRKDFDQFKKGLAIVFGLFVSSTGFIGAVLTIFIDDIRKRPTEWGWMQVWGVRVFVIIFLLGATFVGIMRRREK